MKISGPVLADHLLPTGLPGGQGLNKECQALSADGAGGEFFLIFPPYYEVMKIFIMSGKSKKFELQNDSSVSYKQKSPLQ